VKHIPASFELFGVTVRVLRVPANCIQGESGEADVDQGLIRINSELPEDQQEQTFYHELFHVLTDSLSIKMKHKDIDRMGNLMHQAVSTMEFE